ncbi:MAG TPA: Gldg family protein, partial [Minicystis sp.]|nr:Gldg family protein [Minicystis sp.]
MSAERRGTTWVTKLSSSAGVVAAVFLAVLLNVLAARHFKRWDWTKGGLYTLSDATLSTLRGVEEPIQVYVLLSSGDPLSVAVEHLLDAYRAESSRIEVLPTDPDRHPAEFLAIQQRYGVVAGKTEDGRIVTDAEIIVVRGDEHRFITSKDLVEIDDADDTRARPRIEQALTGAIRGVLAKDEPVACFTTGHGEAALDAGGASGAGALRDKLVKNNFAIRTIGPVKGERPEDARLIDACRVLI